MRGAPPSANERELERVARLYDALSSANQAIVQTRDREQLCARVCSALVEKGGFALSWIGWNDPATHRLVPIARAGAEASYVDAVRVYTDERPEGRGPSGTAFREGRAYVTADILSDPKAAPWHAELARRGFRASAVFPLRQKGAVGGILNVYATEARSFEAREVALLEEVAADLSFALDNLAREEERAQAQAAAENERLFSAEMIESMPGVVYFYDGAGRFLRWNRNFEVVSGYGAAEIASMHPLDFFAGEERELVAARIGEVFAKGESWVEASLVAKDGTKRPYYFTGRRVTFQGKSCLVGVGIDVSERKRSEERFRSTVDSIVEGCQLIAFDWTYVYLNATAAAHNRRPNAELLGRTMQEAWPGIEASEVFALLRRCMEERVPLHGETLFTFPDGSSNWFDVRVQPVPEGIFVLSIDIADRKRTEAEAARAEKELLEAKADLEKKVQERTAELDEAMRFLDAIIDHLPNAVFYKDANLRFLGVNRAYERAFGVKREAMIGKTVLELEYLPAADRRRYQDEQLALVESSVPVRREADMPFADGRVHQTLYSVIGIRRADGSAAGVVGSIVDVTPLKETEAALARAMKAAEAADRIKSAFLATMSHELRTPLNSIIGFTGILLQGLAGPLNEEQNKQLSMVRGSARHLLELINDVLDISKIEAGQMTVRCAPFDLRALLERVVATVEPLAHRKGLALRLTVAPALPSITSDQRRVEQILLNLLNNAVKFTERGTVTLDASLADGVSPRVRLCVIDTGPGIAPDDQALLFQPFRQIDTGLTRKYEGTGLGLAICKRLTAMLGGDITLASDVGSGSTFTVTLPLEPTS